MNQEAGIAILEFIVGWRGHRRSTEWSEGRRAGLVGAHETETALALVHLAKARVDIALHAAVVELLPVLRRNS